MLGLKETSEFILNPDGIINLRGRWIIIENDIYANLYLFFLI